MNSGLDGTIIEVVIGRIHRINHVCRSIDLSTLTVKIFYKGISKGA